MSLTEIKNRIDDAIQAAVHEEVQAIVSSEIEHAVHDATINITKRLSNLADLMAIRVLRYYKVEMMGENMTIEVKKISPDALLSD
jgi:hypothetical protein